MPKSKWLWWLAALTITISVVMVALAHSPSGPHSRPASPPAQGALPSPQASNVEPRATLTRRTHSPADPGLEPTSRGCLQNPTHLQAESGVSFQLDAEVSYRTCEIILRIAQRSSDTGEVDPPGTARNRAEVRVGGRVRLRLLPLDPGVQVMPLLSEIQTIDSDDDVGFWSWKVLATGPQSTRLALVLSLLKSTGDEVEIENRPMTIPLDVTGATAENARAAAPSIAQQALPTPTSDASSSTAGADPTNTVTPPGSSPEPAGPNGQPSHSWAYLLVGVAIVAVTSAIVVRRHRARRPAPSTTTTARGSGSGPPGSAR